MNNNNELNEGIIDGEVVSETNDTIVVDTVKEETKTSLKEKISVFGKKHGKKIGVGIALVATGVLAYTLGKNFELVEEETETVYEPELYDEVEVIVEPVDEAPEFTLEEVIYMVKEANKENEE